MLGMAAPGADDANPWGPPDLSWSGDPAQQLCRFSFAGQQLCVSQSGGEEASAGEGGKSLKDAVRLGNTGLVVWPSASVLCRYIEFAHGRGALDLSGASVLDLGAGTGLLIPGSVAAPITLRDSSGKLILQV